MANKLAPRTFTCVVTMRGMKKLSDGLAYNQAAANGLNARWSRNAASPSFLSPGAQAILFVCHPAQLAEMKRLGTPTKIVSVHGVDDQTCLSDGEEMVANLQHAGPDSVPVWVAKKVGDGTRGHRFNCAAATKPGVVPAGVPAPEMGLLSGRRDAHPLWRGHETAQPHPPPVCGTFRSL